MLGPVTGAVDLGSADAKLIGENAFDWAGYSVSGAGDVDGDGLDDLFVGAPQNSAGGLEAGAAYLVLGPVSRYVDLAVSADATLVGEEALDEAGCSVSGAGDVDGDGLDDLLVGARESDAGADDAGAAFLVLGPVSGNVGLALADARILSGSPLERAGIVSDAGDVDADGFADVLVGASASSVGGAAYVLLGPLSGTRSLSSAEARLVGEVPGDHGDKVSGAGDVDGDGFDDLIFGSAYNGAGGDYAGAAYRKCPANPS